MRVDRSVWPGMSGASVAFLAAMLCGIASLSAAQSTAGLPVRNLTVSGAAYTTNAFVDIPLFSQKINPLDDGRESPPLALWFSACSYSYKRTIRAGTLVSIHS